MAQMFGVTHSRISEIRRRAERKLRHPSVAGKIINTGFSEIYTKVNITRDQIDKAECNFEVHGECFGIEKTFELKSYGEFHTMSIFVNNVKVYYKEWNLDLME